MKNVSNTKTYFFVKYLYWKTSRWLVYCIYTISLQVEISSRPLPCYILPYPIPTTFQHPYCLMLPPLLKPVNHLVVSCYPLYSNLITVVLPHDAPYIINFSPRNAVPLFQTSQLFIALWCPLYLTSPPPYCNAVPILWPLHLLIAMLSLYSNLSSSLLQCCPSISTSLLQYCPSNLTSPPPYCNAVPLLLPLLLLIAMLSLYSNLSTSLLQYRPSILTSPTPYRNAVPLF